MENHKQYENSIKLFIENKLSLNERRKFVFHLDDCKACRDMLIDEYTFHVIFNDKDNNIISSYTDNLNELISNIKNDIIKNDKNLRIQYILLSAVIISCFIFSVSLILSIILKL